jgi:hypothetical protein
MWLLLNERVIMKKFLVFLLFCFMLPCSASNWLEMFEKKYIDLESIQLDYKNNQITFWLKSLRKDATEKFEGMEFWYTLDQFTIDCSQKRASLNVLMVYDLKQKLIFSNEWEYKDWQTIAPDTYIEGYYRYFCLIPFNDNPLLKR